MHLPSLHLQHTQELVSCSGIHPHLAALNFLSLEGQLGYEYLLISHRLPRTNTGQINNNWLRRYSHVILGGWWCSGLDPLDNWKPMEWGCYKPNNPRQNHHSKLIKYEHPPCTPTRIFCLRISLDIWCKICKRYELEIPSNIVLTDTGEALGFWAWVIQQKIPVIICEGVKKAAALLSLGYVAIALPGITSGYRVNKDISGRIINRQLIPELAIFTQNNSTLYICFDYETEPHKIKIINQAIAQIGELLSAQGSLVKVIRLPGLEKGVDDFIIAQGAEAFAKIYQTAANLEIDIALTKTHNELTYNPALIINRRYLGEIPFPKAGLIGIKSAKGTGKTTALETLVKQAKKTNKPVLLLTHRIQLGRFLCDKIGINWLNNTNHHPQSPSLGICIDSLCKLKPQDWQGAIIILDEVEQSLWHLLNSDTCKDKRVKILKIFQQIISIVLQTGGLVIAQDADLSDLSLEYLQGIAGIKIEPWVVVNEWKPQTGWQVTFYDSPNPSLLIQQLEMDLVAGLKCYVTTDNRSGKYSSETIHCYIKQRLEEFYKKYPKTLLISSQTTTTPGHEAVNFVETINQKVEDYDAVFVTPSLGTGVSIDSRHFDRVYGIFQGVIPDWEARQALARVRSNAPRIVWSAKRGIGIIGGGSTNYRVMSNWYQENQKENLALMSPLHKVDVDLPLVYDPIHLKSWAKFGARVNASITLYRQSLKEGLINEGHDVNVISDIPPQARIKQLRQALILSASKDWETSKKLVREIVQLQTEVYTRNQKTKDIKNNIKEFRKTLELEMAIAVANAADIDGKQSQYLLSKRYLTDIERHQLNKYILQQRYGVQITPELKLRDDKGYYKQLLTHYYLIHETEYFQLRDFQEWSQHLQRGEGKVFLPDLKTYTLKVEAMKVLGINNFLHPERQFKENDLDLITLRFKAMQCSKHIKRAIGINLYINTEKEQISTIKILGKILSILGLKLKYINSRNSQSIKVYEIDPATLFDGRQSIFAVWHFRDRLNLQTELLIANC